MKAPSSPLLLALAAALPGAEAAAPADDPRPIVRVHDTSLSPFLRTHDGGKLGDPFPVCWDGVWHLYTMSAGADAVLHYTSTDLVRWAEHEPAMMGHGICTGSVVRHGGRYYLFYTDSEPQTIRVVKSDNPWQFDFQASRLAAEADGRLYQKGWFRDAFVFRNEEEQQWWMLVEGRCPEVCVGLLKSRNLLEWTPCAPILKDRTRAFGSCPQILRHGDLWYLALQDMGNWVYTAPKPTGPWTSRGQYLSLVVEAASRFATDGTRVLAWGWLCDWDAKPLPRVGSYGGPMSVGREIVFHADGSIGVRPLPELLAAMRRRAARHNLAASARRLSGEWQVDTARQTVRCLSPEGGLILLDPPEKSPDGYFEADLVLGSAGAQASVVVRSSETADRGYGLTLNPAGGRLAIYRLSPEGGHRLLNDKPYAYPDPKRVRVQLFVYEEHLEAFVDGRECLSARVPDCSAYRLVIELSRGSGSARLGPF